MLKAFRKLSLRDQLVLAGAGILIFTAMIVITFLLFTGSIFKFVEFPKSTLVDTDAYQKYELKSYDDLNVTVAFPGTRYCIDVKGSEMPGSTGGALFESEDGVYIYTGMVKNGGELKDAVETGLAGYFGGGLLSDAKYARKTHGEGYLNKLYAEYEGGILTVDGTKYYCLFYRYPPTEGDADDLVFSTVRREDRATSKVLAMDKAFVLDHMLYTLKMSDEVLAPALEPLEEMDVSDRDNTGSDVQPDNNVNTAPVEVTPSDPAAATDVVSSYRLDVQDEFNEMSGESTEEDEDPDAPIKEEEDSPSKGLAESIKKRKEDEFNLAYPGQEIFREHVEIPENLVGKDVGVELFFTEVYTDVLFANLKNKETGRVESAEYLNTDTDGEVLFFIDNCEGGDWELELERTAALGKYMINVTEEDALRSIMKK